jgi:hypothetical protein
MSFHTTMSPQMAGQYWSDELVQMGNSVMVGASAKAGKTVNSKPSASDSAMKTPTSLILLTAALPAIGL